MGQTKDYYKILGITEEEKKLNDSEFSKVIKNKYRALSKQKHPDVGGNEEEFKEIAEAYEVLGDGNKRAQYENQLNNPYGGTQFQDIFSQMFGGNPFGGVRQQSASPKIVKVKVTPVESFLGSEKIITYFKENHCQTCSGSGGDRKPCGGCGGTGFKVRQFGTGFMVQHIRTNCDVCAGKGFTISVKCHSCNGKGAKSVANEIKVGLPVGIDDGQYLKLDRLGDFNNGEYGDLIVQVEMTPQDGYEKINNDLVYNIFLNYEELKNSSYMIPHPNGNLNVQAQKTFDTSKPLRLKGKGYNGVGDMYVKLNVKFDRV